MSLINRLTTWAAGQILKSADLNGEFNNIVNLINNLDGATTTWTNVKATTLTATNAALTTITTSPAFSPTTNGLKGTTVGDNASAGNVGEQISATGTVSSTGTTNYFDVASIALTSGDWDVSGQVVFSNSGTTTFTRTDMGISSTAGNSSSGLTTGDNLMQAFPVSGTSNGGATVAAFRVNISSSATYYLKCRIDFTGGTPSGIGRISARRVR